MGKCNITLSFECDRSWEELTRTEGVLKKIARFILRRRQSKHRFCDGCQQNVYWISSDQEGEDHAQLGHCIAFSNPPLMGHVIPPYDSTTATKPPPPPRRVQVPRDECRSIESTPPPPPPS